LLGLSLAIPVFLWMQPHWKDLVTLEKTAGKLAGGDFSARVHLPSRSGVRQVGVAFNHMADSIAALLASKKALTNAVAHELRTRWHVCATGWPCWKAMKTPGQESH
jgi:two-component system sensor histidine kinase RstB